MSRTLKVAIFQVDGEEPTLRTALLNIEGLRLVGQWDGSANLTGLVTQTRPDALAVLLNGPSAENLLEKIAALIRDHPGLTVLGVGLPNEPVLLKAAMRARLTELLDLPVDPEKLLGALQTVAEKLATRPAGRLVAVRGTGGGCGATTVAANVAVELAKRDAGPVVVVDLDLRYGQIATMFDLSPAFTLAELAHQSDEFDEHVLENALSKHETGVYVLARPRDPENANVSLVKIAAILNALLENYAWVVVDETGRSDMTARVVQDLADHLLLVTQPVVTSLRNATQMSMALSSGFNMDRLHVVVNRVPKKLGAVTLERISECLKRPVYCEIPEDLEAVSQSINLGVPLARQAPDSRVRAAIRGLAAKLAGEQSPDATQSPRVSVMHWLKDRLRRS